MPTHHAGAAQIRQDPIWLNNLLNEAETRLTGRGLRRPDAEALLGPAAELIDSPEFWQRRSEGLALYLARGFMRVIDLPYQPEERLSTGRVSVCGHCWGCWSGTIDTPSYLSAYREPACSSAIVSGSKSAPT